MMELAQLAQLAQPTIEPLRKVGCDPGAPRHREHTPPSRMGLCAGARGMAGHRHRHGDHLLLWWRSGGRERAWEVRYFLGLRAALAWRHGPPVADVAIGSAMQLVATRKAPAAGATAKALGIRKATFLAMRGQAVKWLQRGVDEAVAAYQSGTTRTRI